MTAARGSCAHALRSAVQRRGTDGRCVLAHDRPRIRGPGTQPDRAGGRADLRLGALVRKGRGRGLGALDRGGRAREGAARAVDARGAGRPHYRFKGLVPMIARFLSPLYGIWREITHNIIKLDTNCSNLFPFDARFHRMPFVYTRCCAHIREVLCTHGGRPMPPSEARPCAKR